MKSKITFFLFSLFFALFFAVSAHSSDDAAWPLNASTENGLFVVSLHPKAGEAVIGDYHDWIIEVSDETGAVIEGAEFSVGGGMAAHGHGLPSQPIVTQYLGDGKYLVEGVLFNMAGDWTLMVAIRKDTFTDKAQFNIALGF